jgi:hypothetical protein
VNDAAKARNVEAASKAAVGCDHDLDLSTCQTILSTLTKNLRASLDVASTPRTPAFVRALASVVVMACRSTSIRVAVEEVAACRFNISLMQLLVFSL